MFLFSDAHCLEEVSTGTNSSPREIASLWPQPGMSEYAPSPESLDEVVALFVVPKLQKGRPFFIGDDPIHVFDQPLAICVAQLGLERLFDLSPFFRDGAL